MKNESKNKVYVIYDEYSTGGEPESDEAYCSRSPEVCTFYVKGVFVGEDQGNLYTESCEVDFDPDKVTDVYVVYGSYSTGDTFGYTTGKGHIVGAYDTYDKAKTIKRLIEEIYSAYSDRSRKEEMPKEVIKEWCEFNKIPIKD